MGKELSYEKKQKKMRDGLLRRHPVLIPLADQVKRIIRTGKVYISERDDDQFTNLSSQNPSGGGSGSVVIKDK